MKKKFLFFNRKISLKWKILFYFSFIFLILGISLSFLLYKSNEKLILSSIGTQAQNISDRAITYIDPEDYQKVLSKIEKEPFSLEYAQTVVDSKEFRELNSTLDEFRLTQGAKYVYTMSFLPNGDFVYVVDGYTILDKVTNGQGDAGISPPGLIEEDEGLIESAKQVYSSKDKLLGELVDAGDWGILLSSYNPIVDKEGNVIGVLGVDYDGEFIVDQLNTAKKNTILFTSIILLTTIILSLIFSKQLTKPLSLLVSNVNSLSKGDFTVDFKLNSNDELGDLNHSLSSTTENLNNMFQVINFSSEELKASSETLLDHSNNSSDHSDLTVKKIQKLKENYENQLKYTNTSSEVFIQMIGRFQELNTKTNEAYQKSDSVNDTAIKGKEQMGEIITNIDDFLLFQKDYSLIVTELIDKTKQIHQIVGTISEISNQTNLLALNASIEAARAGEHGKGFQVVANEVKKLAEEASDSVKNITNLISSIDSTVNKSVEKIKHTSNNIHSSSSAVKDTTQSFLNIIDEIHLVNDALKDINQISEKLSSETEKSYSSVEELMEITKEASDIVDNFENDLMEQRKKIRHLDKEASSLTTLSKTLHDLIRKFKLK